MVEIKFVDQKRSKLFQEMSKEISDFKQGVLEIEIGRASEGYSGSYELEISDSSDNYFSTNFPHNDLTRFPARIKALATVLKAKNMTGKYKVSHSSGHLKIQKLNPKVPSGSERFSWKTLDDGRVVKELDFSSFNYKGSVVPHSFHSFFSIGEGDSSISLLHEEKKYSVKLKWTRPSSPVVRIWWGEEFSKVLKNNLPNWKDRKQRDKLTNMKLVFKKTSKNNVFDIKILDENSEENERINFEINVENNIRSPLKGKPKGSKKPPRKLRSSEQISRDPDVHSWVLDNSKWVCECCEEPAPFSKSNGCKYLEVHHVKRLADDGSDEVENAVAVCPNCHRELHYGEDRDQLVNSLYKKINRLIRE